MFLDEIVLCKYCLVIAERWQWERNLQESRQSNQLLEEFNEMTHLKALIQSELPQCIGLERTIDQLYQNNLTELPFDGQVATKTMILQLTSDLDKKSEVLNSHFEKIERVLERCKKLRYNDDTWVSVVHASFLKYCLQFYRTKKGPTKRIATSEAELRNKRIAHGLESQMKGLEELLHPYPVSTFLSQHWQKRPHVIIKSHSFTMGLSTLYEFWSDPDFGNADDVIISEGYGDGTTMLFPIGENVLLSIESLHMFIENGGSMKLLQPHRHSHRSMLEYSKLVQEIESDFACTCSFTIDVIQSDKGHSISAAPNSEIFVIQLAGCSQWQLSKGDDLSTVNVNVGDTLYIPSGWESEAIATSEGSTYGTLSTYSANTWFKFLQTTLSNALDLASEVDPRYSQKLPIGFSSEMGILQSQVSSIFRTNFNAQAKLLISSLQEYIDTDLAVDEMQLEYVKSRFPPDLDDNEESCLEEDLEIKLSDWVKMNDPSLYRVVHRVLTRDDTDMEEGDDDDLSVISCLSNSRKAHMTPGCQSDDEVSKIVFDDQGEEVEQMTQYCEEVTFPGFYLDGLVFLSKARLSNPLSGGFVQISDIPLADDFDKIGIVRGLSVCGLLHAQSKPPA